MAFLVTGATGFIGKALITYLLSKACEVKALVRQSSIALPVAVDQVVVGDLVELTMDSSSGFLREILNAVDVVIHTAARVHVMSDDASNPLTEFRKVNRDATLVLARLAAESGVKRFVFLSSIKVNGEMTKPSHPFTSDDVHVPGDPYGLSKYEAEQGLLALGQETGMEVVIIRPPLVYGPGVKANFASMMKWMGKPVLLPFGAIHNQRSLVALDNLVSFISLCADRKKSPQAANQVFLISDGEDVSTTQLLRKVGQALNLQSPSGINAW
ncbi:NAD-dependent epimerase/dehydratase family protein, partial [Oceanospirillaceae bacterium]|nr:NAD-dependent epimerase/dehydratase family protein [Oceanospirillaceae bacterium]